MIKRMNSLEAVLSLLLGFIGRGYIIAGAIWFFMAADQGQAFEWINGITPFAGILPGLALLLIAFIFSLIKDKIRAKKTGTQRQSEALNAIFGMEMKTYSFSLQSMILLILAAINLALGSFMEASVKWPITLVIVACISYFGIMLNKHSGAKTSGSEGESIKKTVIAFVIMGLTCAAGVVFLEPISKALRWLYNSVISALKWIWLTIHNFFAFIISLIYPGEIIEQPFEYPIEDFNIPEIEYSEPSDIARFVVVGISILLIACISVYLIVLLVKYLIKISMRKRQAKITGTAVEIQRIEFKNFFKRIAEYFSRKSREIKAKWLLMNHPSSFGRVLTKVEKRMRKRSNLRRQEGETVREFIGKLKTRYKGENQAIFDEFLDAFDRAVYGPDKSWLAEYPNAREFLKEVSKKV